jgi:hypothetical protein
MKASTNSLHARLYDFTYDSTLPDNLCPYFWKLIWATVIFPFNLFLQLPGLIVGERFCENNNMYMLGSKRAAGLMFYLASIALFVWGISTFHWVKAICGAYSYNSEAANTGWLINLLIAGTTLALWLSTKEGYTSKRKENPSIIKEFIKAKYNNYCPKIDWE